MLLMSGKLKRYRKRTIKLKKSLFLLLIFIHFYNQVPLIPCLKVWAK